MIAITRVLAAEHQLFRAIFTDIRGVLANLSGLFFPLLERMFQPDTLTAMGTAWFLQHHAPRNWVI